MNCCVCSGKQAENYYWPERRGQTDKQWKKQISIKTNTVWGRKGMKVFSKSLLYLWRVLIWACWWFVIRLRHLWGDPGLLPLWLDGRLIDIHRRRMWFDEENPTEERKKPTFVLKHYLSQTDKGQSGRVCKVILFMWIKVCHQTCVEGTHLKS